MKNLIQTAKKKGSKLPLLKLQRLKNAEVSKKKAEHNIFFYKFGCLARSK